MTTKNTKLAIARNYTAMIQGSVGTKMFQHLYMRQDAKNITDVLDGGALSCAYFASFILYTHDLMQSPHATVDSAVKDLAASGWKPIRKPKIGAVLVWETQQQHGEPHRHIGFYIGRNEAISNSTTKKVPAKHHWTFNSKRKIEQILWHPLLGK